MLMQCFGLLMVLLCYAQADTQCQTGANCKPITDCPILFEYLAGPITHEIANFLKKHQCGFFETTPKVCCPTSSPRNLLADPTKCGYFTTPRIVGGEEADLGEFPWMALLQYKKHIKTLIVEDLSSAKDMTSVRLGEHDIESPIDCYNTTLGSECAPKPLDIPIEETFVHELYKDDLNKYHDIGLIRLAQEVQFTEYVRPICIPQMSEELNKTYTNIHPFIAGWGVTENKTRSNVKLKLQVPIRDNNYCEDMFRRFNYNVVLSVNQYCAGGEKGKDSCRGDSGGPLMTVRIDKNKGSQWYAAGIISFGNTPCGQVNFAAVYTRISLYLPWIKIKLRP